MVIVREYDEFGVYNQDLHFPEYLDLSITGIDSGEVEVLTCQMELGWQCLPLIGGVLYGEN